MLAVAASSRGFFPNASLISVLSLSLAMVLLADARDLTLRVCYVASLIVYYLAITDYIRACRMGLSIIFRGLSSERRVQSMVRLSGRPTKFGRFPALFEIPLDLF